MATKAAELVESLAIALSSPIYLYETRSLNKGYKPLVNKTSFVDQQHLAPNVPHWLD